MNDNSPDLQISEQTVLERVLVKLGALEGLTAIALIHLADDHPELVTGIEGSLRHRQAAEPDGSIVSQIVAEQLSFIERIKGSRRAVSA